LIIKGERVADLVPANYIGAHIQRLQ
jgi:hypothetical protein